MLHLIPTRSLRPLALALGAALLGACAADGNDPSTAGEVNPSRVEAITCSMAACRTALQTFDGTTAYSNGSNTGSGYSCNGEGGRYGYEYQCVELVQRHFTTHWGIHWRGNAKDLLNNAPRASVDVYYNGDAAHPPVPGDMIVWTSGAYGHVALVSAVHTNSIEIIEQNVCGDGHAVLSFSGGRIGARWGSWVPAGWAHARANTGTGAPTPGPTPEPTDCSGSASGTSSVWTCTSDRGARQRCVSSAVQTEPCANGCNRQPTGVDDTCAPSPTPTPTCHGAADACGSTSECCTGLVCNGGTCGSSPTPAPTCATTGQSCGSSTACCSGLTCNSGTCGTASSVSWDCARSAYNGGQYWTCSGNDRYRCSGGTPVRETCASGCLSRPAGTDDVCASGSTTPTWDCSRSAYNGGQYWTCSGGSIYRCSGGTPQVTNCPSGCTVRPVGTDDTCN